MRLKEKKILQKFAAILKKFSPQGATKADYGRSIVLNDDGVNIYSSRCMSDPNFMAKALTGTEKQG